MKGSQRPYLSLPFYSLCQRKDSGSEEVVRIVVNRYSHSIHLQGYSPCPKQEW